MTPQTGELLVREVAPRIHSLAPSLNPVGADDIGELEQEGIAIAAVLLASAEARGKKVSAGNVSFYAARLVRQGRRSGGLSKTDVMHPATQIHGRSSMVSLDAPLTSDADGEEITCLHETLASRVEDPSMAATRRLDWAPLVESLDYNARQVLACLVIGENLTSLKSKLRRSRSAIQTDKEKLARLVSERLGDDILLRVQEQPHWRDNVEASREKCACRVERQRAA